MTKFMGYRPWWVPSIYSVIKCEILSNAFSLVWNSRPAFKFIIPLHTGISLFLCCTIYIFIGSYVYIKVDTEVVCLYLENILQLCISYSFLIFIKYKDALLPNVNFYLEKRTFLSYSVTVGQ